MDRGTVQQRLAIGVDAAEGNFVRELVSRGELPVMAGLLRGGRWLDVESPAVGSGSVWPTFVTGTEPEAHGMYGDWTWRPDEMRVTPEGVDGLRPFWARFAEAGHRVGVVDVPVAPHTGVTEGFEVTEWGPHDVRIGSPRTSPAWVQGEVGAGHPFWNDRTPTQTSDERGLNRLARACLQGARLRGDLVTRLMSRAKPDLALVVFSEVHHAAHRLWHTVGDGHGLLRQVYREVDTQIGRMIDAAPAETPVAVFSLHGMRPARGVVTALQPVLEALGFATATSAVSMRRRLLGEIKRLAPGTVKRAYYRLTPRAVTIRVAEGGMLPALDWSRTRAFALPSDQNGWVRVNLEGRERDGIVSPADYEGTRRELATALAALRSPAGEPLVREVIATAGPSEHLPDLIVHWSEAACRPRLRVPGLDVEAEAEAPDITGQHTRTGFCMGQGLGGDGGPTTRNADLARLLFGHP